MSDFPWIKFIILFIPLSVFMFIFSPTLKWKLLFIVAGGIGVYIALAFGTIGGKH
ncbi:hypothetical protein LCGC14_2197310 [marine sediment metagenome]|uniref:Uncharacterized protein n=1 Tax=marine sediment metagenome TaxID=412755 RepID=A0A0F9DHS2_9ZZZZ